MLAVFFVFYGKKTCYNRSCYKVKKIEFRWKLSLVLFR
nr:MAG TPA: hypothetical protein [Caudoviricetes sp.]